MELNLVIFHFDAERIGMLPMKKD